MTPHDVHARAATDPDGRPVAGDGSGDRPDAVPLLWRPSSERRVAARPLARPAAPASARGGGQREISSTTRSEIGMKLNHPFRFGRFLDLAFGPCCSCSNSHFGRQRARLVGRKGSPTVFDRQNALFLMPGIAWKSAGGTVHSVGVAVQNPS